MRTRKKCGSKLRRSEPQPEFTGFYIKSVVLYSRCSEITDQDVIADQEDRKITR